ncbi:hypothetical protein RRF57_008604 [Xylaria bambusicola]|uniref:Uncharacterized protein n=1 Tax=Xylaria bambusicola TaxID=326684 RepID=A0AAN7UVK8_9PEZI
MSEVTRTVEWSSICVADESFACLFGSVEVPLRELRPNNTQLSNLSTLNLFKAFPFGRQDDS